MKEIKRQFPPLKSDPCESFADGQTDNLNHRVGAAIKSDEYKEKYSFTFKRCRLKSLF